MAQAGFSGEPRYLLPGVALLTVAAAAGWTDLYTRMAANSVHPPKLAPSMRVFAVVLAGALLLAAAPRGSRRRGAPRAQAYQWDLQADLAAAVETAGGPGPCSPAARPTSARSAAR